MKSSHLRPFFGQIKPLLFGVVIIGVVVAGFAVWRFEWTSAAEQKETIEAQPQVSVINGQTVLNFPLAAQKADGIAVAQMRAHTYHKQNRAYGTVIDPQGLSDMHNSYASAEAQLQINQAKLHQSALTFERAQHLLEVQAESVANRDAAEASYRVDQATVVAAQTQLETLASTTQQDWGTVLGQAIIKGTLIFRRLADQQDVLVQATFPPGVMFTNPPRNALASWGNGHRVKLEFLSSAPKTDIHIQGASLFYLAPGNVGLLPNMNVNILMPSDKVVTGVGVPPSAIVWNQGEAWIYVRIDPTHFVRRPIASDLSEPDGNSIATGLRDGTSVVVRGAQTLLSQEFRSQTPAEDGDSD